MKKANNIEITSQEIANWFLSRISMSPKKLQKMLYYAYSWVLTLTNDSSDHIENKLFNDSFEAWAHGPVLMDIYHHYKDCGYNNIPKYEGKVVKLPDEIDDILNQVIDVYGKYTADQLESITHQESPWINARKDLSPLESSNNMISDQDIFSCYIKRVSED